MQSSESGRRLAELIDRAIADGEVTRAEYDSILAMADADQVLDMQERALLAQLNQLLADGTVKRVP